MSYSFSTLDDGSIIQFVINSDFSMEKDSLPLVRDCAALLDAAPDRAVMVFDSRNLSMSSMSDVLAMGSVVRDAEAKAMLNHPKLLKMLSVTQNKVLQMTIKGVNTATFGFVEFSLYDSVEEALNAARTLLYGQAKAN